MSDSMTGISHTASVRCGVHWKTQTPTLMNEHWCIHIILYYIILYYIILYYIILYYIIFYIILYYILYYIIFYIILYYIIIYSIILYYIILYIYISLAFDTLNLNQDSKTAALLARPAPGWPWPATRSGIGVQISKGWWLGIQHPTWGSTEIALQNCNATAANVVVRSPNYKKLGLLLNPTYSCYFMFIAISTWREWSAESSLILTELCSYPGIA